MSTSPPGPETSARCGLSRSAGRARRAVLALATAATIAGGSGARPAPFATAGGSVLRPTLFAKPAGPLATDAAYATAGRRGIQVPLSGTAGRYGAPPPTSVTADGAVPVVVSAVFADGYAAGDADEAVQIWNVGDVAVDVGGWAIDDGEGTASLPAGATLGPACWSWLARDAAAFARSFGHDPEWATEPAGTPAGRLVTTGGGPRLANDGDEVVLRARGGAVVDTVVYGDGADSAGWTGPGVRPYRTASIAGTNQVLYRKLAGATGQPVPDSDRAVDWASDPADVALGRRVRFPGWDVETEVRPLAAVARGRLEIAVAPDALLGFLRRHLSSARASIDLSVYTFENPDLAEVVADRARSGVRVRVLVDGAPTGGIDLNARWCLALIATAGGDVRFLDDGGDVRARYRGAHAKVAIIDDRLALVGSENPGLGAAPGDDPADGTAGRRGAYVATDAPAVVGWVRDLLERDIDPERHVDVRPFQVRDPRRGAPPADFVPEREGGGAGYRPRFAAALVDDATIAYELVTAPERALDPSSGLLGLVGRAGPGDEVLVEQLAEPTWWGGGPGEGEVARNPRVEAYLSAARRGARVRVLLDGHFDAPAHWNSNAATVRDLAAAARSEGLDLQARLGDPTGGGIHNKMVLVHLTGAGSQAAHWVHLGSLNGSEMAHKANREVALQLESEPVHGYLARVFAWDWATTFALALPALGMTRAGTP